jgi:hypothetical protein
MKITKLPNGGELHENSDGNNWWYLNGVLHREDGPAFEWADGSKSWWLNGKRHREDGPAIEFVDGIKIWFVDHIQMNCETQKQFEQLMKLKAFW